VYKRQIYQIAESNRIEKIDSVAWVDLGPTHRRLRHRETASGLHQCVPCTLPLSTSPKIGARSSAMNVSVYMSVRSHISKIHKSNFTNSRGQRQRYSPARVDVIKRSVWPRSSIESRFTGCFFSTDRRSFIGHVQWLGSRSAFERCVSGASKYLL